jgi:sigma-B regulation protein RsbU (phosphoserine phosphatase)
MLRFPILFCASQPRDDVSAILSQDGYRVHYRDFAQAESSELPAFDFIVIDATHQSEHALRVCHALHTRKGDRFIPILVLANDSSPRARLANLTCGADIYVLHPFEPAELLKQVQTFHRMKERHDRLLAKTAEVDNINQQLRTAHQQIDLEMELARRLQQSFLPQSLPAFPRVRFAVHYTPCGKVGGDFYDAFRLDEHHVGCYVADAMGHGVPASLLAMFVKKGVRSKEISGKEYRLVQPGEVLQKLNRDLIDQALSEQPFVTMAYALFDFQSGVFRFARSGHPYPLVVPKEGRLQLWKTDGMPLGVFETQYPVRSEQLQPGDKVVLYTDGLDSARFKHHPAGTASLVAAAEHFRGLPIAELIDRLAEDLFLHAPPSDDLTLLGMEYA